MSSSPKTYGALFADAYDAMFQNRDDLNVVSEVLLRLAAGRPILELGIGTGRLALPLVERGATVAGIDNSPEMLAKLAAKPGAEHIHAVVGDCARDRVEGQFGFVFIGFSTLFLIASQEEQVACFQNAARHLPIGGHFLVEGFVHDRSSWHHNQELVTTRLSAQSLSIRGGVLDPAQQLIRTQQVDITADGISFRPNQLRFVYPAEMDLMGRLAGFRLQERWSDWKYTPFSGSSTTQIAVYEKVADHAI